MVNSDAVKRLFDGRQSWGLEKALRRKEIVEA
jgi:hypothetical protein